jgi:hypothetical protein
VLLAAVVCLLLMTTGTSSAATSSSYPNIAFSDGFESGSLSSWDGNLGSPGTIALSAAAARTGLYGARLTNGPGQYALIMKDLAAPLADSSSRFWVRVSATGGVQTLAQARDQSGSHYMWSLLYDATHQGLWFYPYNGAGASTEIFTGLNSVPVDTWFQVEVQYTATAAGGAQLYVNGQTNSAWGVSGDYTQPNGNMQRLLLWNDSSSSTTDFDDVSVAAAPGTPPAAPTSVQGAARNQSVAVTWTAPADGGSPITGYQVTPYVNGVARTPVLTNSAATSFTVTGLTNGTAYTFTVAAINSLGTGSASAASAAVTPTPASAPAAPSGVQGTPSDGAVNLGWSAPGSDGGSPITGYRITPSINGVAQAPILTGSSATSQFVSGLTNGTAYTFTVAAVNAVGTGPNSAASAAITPVAAATRYTNTKFSDGFESGSLSAWDGTAGSPGTTAVTAAAAHNGSFGARLTNASGQYALIMKTLAAPLQDSSVKFWARVNATGGVQTLAMGRDQSGSHYMWSVLYDANHQGVWFYPYNGAGRSSEVFTGPNSVPLNTWFQVEVQYTATATGGAQLYINGQTNSAWGVSGDYTQPNGNLQRVQLWNDSSTSTTDFDTAQVATNPPAAPNAPTGVQGQSRDTGVAVSWSAPAFDGGSPITGYQVTPYVNGVAQTPILTNSTATNYMATGLTNGTTYTFTVAAINAVGTGANSAASAAVTPSPPTVPGVPTAVQVTPSDGAANVTWTSPASDGGSAITGYIITPYINGVAQQAVDETGSSVEAAPSTVTSQYIGGLTNGTTYTFTVRANNAIGSSAESGASAPATPVAAVTKYSSVLFSDGFESGSLSAWNGTGGGTGTVTVTRPAEHDGNFGARMSDTSGQYALLIKALDAPVVDSSVTFWARVGATGGIQTLAQARDGASAHYMWSVLYDANHQALYFYPYNGAGASTEIYTGTNSAPANTWIKVTVQYTATATGGAQLYINGQTNSAWGVTGNYAQANGALQRVQLWNDSGYPSGAGSTTDFDDVTIAAAPNAPDAPTGVQGTPHDKSVALTWTAPANDGGGAISGYQVTPYVNGVAQTPIPTNSTAPSFTVNGLTNGTAYTFAVAAINSAGMSPASTRSAAITPVAPTSPGAPSNVQGTPRDTTVALTWAAPTSDGGSAITGYRVTPSVNGVAQTPVLTGSTSTSYTVTGLTDGTAYTFTVAAVNAVGAGAESAASPSYTPAAPTVPWAPTNLQGVAHDQTVALTWTTPASDDGSPITGYQVTPYVNGTAQTPIRTNSTSTSFTVTGLTNGTTYTFTVAAINAIGAGPESTATPTLTPVAPTAPDAPTGVSGTPRDSAVVLGWTGPASDGGSAITGYQVTPFINGAAQTPILTSSTSTSYTVGGLSNGTAYTFAVAAINGVGTGVASSPSAAVTPVTNPPNPIVLENQQPGTTSWHIDQLQDGTPQEATNHQIEGYASQTSVNQGGQISFMASTSASAQYTMDVYRMGWYPKGTNPDGTSCAPSCGGRLMQHIGPLNGTNQPACPTVATSTSPDYGMIECHWSPGATVTIPSSWTTGNYIVKLKRLDDNLESYITFVVRNDSYKAPTVYSVDTTTWQAYNYWGGAGNNNVGISLYGRVNDVTGNDVAGSRAYTVSFNRPYWDSGETDGAGMFMLWDFPMIRWMESQGYDINYVTDTDLESNPSLLSGHKAFVNVGHDEYYSDAMRANIQNGIASGVNMALFSANNFYWRITWAPDSSGAALRRIHTDKGAASGSTTITWRDLSPAKPENQLSGVMQNGVANNRNFLVSDANSWIYAGAGLSAYTGNGTSGVVTSGPNQNSIPGLIGYEFDERATNSSILSPWTSFEPAGIDQVGHSFVPAADNGVNAWSDATLYTAPSGANVFSAGTIQWSFGLDDGYADGFCDCAHSYTNTASQKITRNILDRFTH